MPTSRRRTLVHAAAILALVPALLAPGSDVEGQVPLCPDDLAWQLLPMINDYRAGFGLDPVVFDARLHTSAGLHAIDIAVNGANDPWRVIGSNGSTPEERMIAAGFPGPLGEVTLCNGLSIDDLEWELFNQPGSDVFHYIGPTHVGIGIAEAMATCGAGWILVVDIGFDTTTVPLLPTCYSGLFRRGDANLDGAMDIGDAIWVLGFLFSGGGPSLCQDSADANDDGVIDIADAITALGALFSGAPLPTAPGSAVCGEDPTADPLDCASSTSCY